MQREPDPERDEVAEERAEVNPAARRDRPGEAPPAPKEEEGTEDRQVHPAQEEPLDPLGPGGIGA